MTITQADTVAMQQLQQRLSQLAPSLALPNAWPVEQLRLCAEAGVFRWFVPAKHGGLGWSEVEIARGYILLAEACLTTSFVITQFVGAMTRIAACENQQLQQRLLPALLAGKSYATIGISHLTTSRRNLSQPVMQAEETADGFLLQGYSPWVTGAEHAQHVVLGAELADRRQILLAFPTALAGVEIPPSPDLVALSASRTGRLNCHQVTVGREWLLAGPLPEVMKHGLAAKTGGLQTSSLALGLSTAAIKYLESETSARPELREPTTALREELAQLTDDLLAFAAGEPRCTNDELRTRANSLVLRSTQATLVAAKGAGFTADHPAGRWCREALFFLVWSCPQPVLQANLCELAGIAS